MKTPHLITACVLSASPFALAAEVQTGDSLADVHTALGTPRGQVKVDGRQVLYFERGEVELQDNAVTRVALRSPQEQMELDARAERHRSERETRLNQLLAEGTAVRDRKLADENFKNAPLVYQVSYWENFSRAYPGVSVIEPLTIARLRLNEQLDAKRAKEEEAALIAQREEQLAQLDGEYYPFYSSYGYGRGYYHGGYNPPNLMPMRYHFQNTSAAPYETPHGSPYETPHGAPYATPTAIDFNYYYRPAPTPRNDWSDKYSNYFPRATPHNRGREQVADRDRRPSRGRY